MVKVRKTASRKMTLVFRGAVLQMLAAFSESGLSFLFSKLAPNEIRFDFSNHREVIAAGNRRINLVLEDESPQADPDFACSHPIVEVYPFSHPTGLNSTALRQHCNPQAAFNGKCAAPIDMRFGN
jgi:hypothetical protein